MVLSTITGLRADIVPRRRWAVSRWFYASPLWYYHRLGASDPVCLDRRFYQLVDPELRPLCRMLNDRGLRTTPSCQGHFHPREHFQRVWQELQCEQSAITRLGLVVKDSETDREYVFQDSGYTLPWPDFDTYFAQAAAHQGTGFLGILLPTDRPEFREAFDASAFQTETASMRIDDQLSQWVGQPAVAVETRPRDAAECSRVWKDVTARIRSFLPETTAPAASWQAGCGDSAVLPA